jgi:alpha-L-fucosidase
VLIRTAGGDGNLLFNVGPEPSGIIEARQVERLKEMGAWLARYGVTIYGTRGGPYRPNEQIASTRRDDTIYIHVLKWRGDTLTLPALPKKVLGSTLLTGGDVEVEQTGDALKITVPAEDHQDIDTIVKLRVDGPAIDIPPLGDEPPPARQNRP